ncbi:MAG: hypothetical protein HKM02_06575 [Pseudomonadales bacterium]|nr:hypothetical protein [Pseudomonadales bacterium]
MKATKLLVLAAAVAAASSAYAMQPMSDSSMSSATGQDGIDIMLQNTNVAINYIRFGEAGSTTTSAVYSGAADVQIAGFGVVAKAPTDIQMRMGSNSAGSAAILLNISANQLTFNPMTVSLNKWSGVQSDLTSDTNQQSANGGMFTLKLGVVTLPAAALTITQGFTDQTTGKAVTGDGITIGIGAQAAIDIKGFGIETTPDQQKAGNAAYLLNTSDVLISNIGASTVSIGALSAAAATANGLTGTNAATAGALWISTSASTIGSVDIAGMQVGDVTSASIGSLGLAGVHMGANNIFISALK